MLVLGESLVDVVNTPDGRTVEHPGGSAANVAVALSRLGRPVRLATAYADDGRGRALAGHLEASGVGLALDPHVVARTSTAAATIGPDGAASYVFDLEWRLGPVPLEPAPVAVHTCSIAAVLAPGAAEVAATIEVLRERATISYDLNVRPAITGVGADVVAAVERLVALTDLVKASDEDLAVLYPGLSVDDAVARLRGLGPQAVVVTRGAAGATWSGSVEVAVEPTSVTVADTIGAGDTFGAATLDALWSLGALGGRLPDLAADQILEVLAYANRAAAVTVSRPGADPPWKTEL
ncbi:MAG: carbohydrate kinase [Actinobacteria bacterium]|nr:carbohydrate kinase [Actinomycetota bacterium]